MTEPQPRDERDAELAKLFHQFEEVWLKETQETPHDTAAREEALLANITDPVTKLFIQGCLKWIKRKRLIAQSPPEISEEIQLEWLAPWYSQNKSNSRTLDLFDAIPKYLYAITTTVPKPVLHAIPFTWRDQKYVASVRPVQITDKETQKEKLVFPGSREELVERALRFIAVQRIAKTRVTTDREGLHAITVLFKLSQIRRHLEELGHGYKLNEIKEALDILSHTFIEIRLDSATESQSKRDRFLRGVLGTMERRVRLSHWLSRGNADSAL
jgi:hypothetical protein